MPAQAVSGNDSVKFTIDPVKGTVVVAPPPAAKKPAAPAPAPVEVSENGQNPPSVVPPVTPPPVAAPIPTPQPIAPPGVETPGTSPDNRGGAKGINPPPDQQPILVSSPVSPANPTPTIASGPTVDVGTTPPSIGGISTGVGTTIPSGAPTAPSPPPDPSGTTDWGNYLGLFGLPADVLAEVNRIFSTTTDLNQATALAMGYIRGTPWYATTYPGIQEAIAKGVVTDEAGYRQYLNQANQLYEQYYGRSIGTDEFSALLKNGTDLSLLSKNLQSGATLTNLQQFSSSNLFSSDELSQIAAQNSGLASQTGQYLNGLLTYAQQVAPLYAQYGAPSSRQTIEANYKAGVDAPTVGKQLAGASYIGANQNDIQYAAGAFGDGSLSASDLQTYGQEKAGLQTPAGDKLDSIITKAQQRLSGVFSGRLANIGLTNAGNPSPNLNNGAKPDVPA